MDSSTDVAPARPHRSKVTRQRTRVSLLGVFALCVGERSVALSRNEQRLVAFVALRDHPVARAEAAGTLWLDATEAHAQGSLRSALWRVHQAGDGVLDAAGTDLRLGSSVTVDIREMTAAAIALSDPSDESETTNLHLAFGTDLLPGWYDDWVIIEREHLRSIRTGSTIPIKVSLVNSAGTNVSSGSIVLTVTGVAPSPGAPAPSGTFTFVSNLNKTAGYQYNLKTKGYCNGSYNLLFTATGDPVTRSAIRHRLDSNLGRPSLRPGVVCRP